MCLFVCVAKSGRRWSSVTDEREQRALTERMKQAVLRWLFINSQEQRNNTEETNPRGEAVGYERVDTKQVRRAFIIMWTKARSGVARGYGRGKSARGGRGEGKGRGRMKDAGVAG